MSRKVLRAISGIVPRTLRQKAYFNAWVMIGALVAIGVDLWAVLHGVAETGSGMLMTVLLMFGAVGLFAFALLSLLSVAAAMLAHGAAKKK